MIHLALALVVAGSYGEAYITLRDARATIDVSVGSLSKPENEAAYYRELLAEANKALASARSDLERTMKFYRTGDHRFKLLRGCVRESGPAAGPGIGFTVSEYRRREIMLRPMLGAAISQPAAHKLAMDVILSQALNPDVGPPKNTSATAAALQFLAGSLVHGNPYEAYAVFHVLRGNEKALRDLATRHEIIPVDSDWKREDAPSGLIIAKAFVAILDGQPYSDETHAMLGKLDSVHASLTANLLALMLPDTDYDKQLSRLRKTLGALAPAGDPLWDGFAEIPRTSCGTR